VNAVEKTRICHFGVITVGDIFVQSTDFLKATIVREFTNTLDLLQDKPDSHLLELAISHEGVSDHYTGLARENLEI
jgi:hypothetical protein